MVYCGKASQGCQSCRTRRIKCDKVRPECTQCVRVRKPCPGYRDPLALMFRDESSKVMQRAHAQWGVAEGSESGEPSASSPASGSSSPAKGLSSSEIEAGTSPTTAISAGRRRAAEPRQLAKEICASPVDKAVQFYIEHYVLGLPDEPKVGQELQGIRWVHAPEAREIMAAVGMAGLSNLTGDSETSTLAKHHYGLALRNMTSSIRNMAGTDVDVMLRVVVMMAMYEVTRARDEPSSPARTHLMGGAAILSKFLPVRGLQGDGPRGLLQMCFSMVSSLQGSLQTSSSEPNVLIPHCPESYSAGGLPGIVFDWISITDKMVSEPDRPSAELIKIIARFAQLSSLVRSQPLVDGQAETAEVIRKALEYDQQLKAWERRQTSIWTVAEERVDNHYFPAEAVFDGCFHVYTNMYIARTWNHYRWAHTLTNQLLLESVDRFPLSSAPLVTPSQQQSSLDRIKQLARGTLVSVPTHYRHPILEPTQREALDRTRGGAEIGIAGIPTLLFEIKVAGCAPGLPRHYRMWALGMLDTVYRDIGMFQAKVLADLLRKKVDNEKEEEVASSRTPSTSGGEGER